MNLRKELSIIHYPLYIALFIILNSSFILSQEKDSTWLNDEWYFHQDSSLVQLETFLPNSIFIQSSLKNYIRNDEFFRLRKLYGDSIAIDAIYDQAMLMTNENIERALFISLLAVMDHYSVKVKIPLFGRMTIPLTTESKIIFDKRHKHLPSKVLKDSLSRIQWDKDKLQHFFGSAYLTYTINSSSIAEWIGNLIEKSEAQFVGEREYDDRDKIVNHLGQEFGMRLLNGEEIFPSDVLVGK